MSLVEMTKVNSLWDELTSLSVVSALALISLEPSWLVSAISSHMLPLLAIHTMIRVSESVSGTWQWLHSMVHRPHRMHRPPVVFLPCDIF